MRFGDYFLIAGSVIAVLVLVKMVGVARALVRAHRDPENFQPPAYLGLWGWLSFGSICWLVEVFRSIAQR